MEEVMNFLGVNADAAQPPSYVQQYMQAALMVSLLSVWMLVVLFFYLNRYTKREYFTVWTTAWLFYALWLTLNLKFPDVPLDGTLFKLKQCCVAVSAVFLLWGSLRFLSLPVPQRLFGLFMAFLLVWTFVSPLVLDPAVDPDMRKLEMQLPVFILLGLGSVFAGVCFYRLRKKMPFVGAGMLALGFFLWGVYLASYPLSQQDVHLYSAGFFMAAVLQLFIAVSMIVLVLEEVRYKNEQALAEIAAVRSEKEALQVKVLSTEEQCRSLYDQVRLTEGLQKAYEELRRTQHVVVQQERLRALGQMASGVAHDVNNALSPIVAYSELLLSTLPDLPEVSKHYLQTINQAGGDIAQIVARMREFYRRRSDDEQLTQVNISKVIEEVIDLTRPRWRDLSQRQGVSINVQCELEPEPPLLHSDAGELREALINLVFNAVDAMPQGGTITFATRSVCAPVAKESAAAERQLVVEVKDNGIGMDEKTRQRCLEPFFSTKAQRGGTGLGLAMVYGMMQRHDGMIEIDSAPGRGTCIRLIFPIQDKPLKSRRDATPQAKQSRALHILCIDDDAQVRQLLNDCLTHFNHRVTVAESGKQGMELFQAALHKSQPYEVVITDLGMPQMDGYQVARSIKTQAPHTPVIMMTGWGTTIREDGAATPEVDAVIGKPPRMQELNDLLLRVTSPGKHNA
jgi:signal transduction histidine kinase/ActR/RegA family two-component response regulator